MTKRKAAKKADIFEVYGLPPGPLLLALNAKEISLLKRYIDRITTRVYRIAYDSAISAQKRR